MSNAELNAEEQLDALLRDGRISPEDYDTLRQALSKGDAEKVQRRRAAGRGKLTKKREGRQLGGVCAGLAEFFGLDAWNVRALFVLSLFLTGGTAVLVYLVLFFALPWSERDETWIAAEEKRRGSVRVFFWSLLALWLFGIFFHFLLMPSLIDVVSSFGRPLSIPFRQLVIAGALWGTPLRIALQLLFLGLLFIIFSISPEKGMVRRWLPRGLMVAVSLYFLAWLWAMLNLSSSLVTI